MTLADLRALCERATKGEWRVSLDGRQDRSGRRYGCDLCARIPKEDQRPWQSSGWVMVAQMAQPSNPSSIHDPHAEVEAERNTNADFIAAARTWLPALIEVAEAARTVGTFDDFGDPEALCPECSPAHPQPFMDARMALHAALARLDEMR